MTMKQLNTRSKTRPGRRTFSRTVALCILGLIALGVGYEAISENQVAAQRPGQLVNVSGHRLHINCMGQGSPTVLLEAGLGGTSNDWFAVQPALAQTTRVCAYDRAGYGWSDESAGPRTVQSLNDELHTLVSQAGIKGPMVLVGHSMGGVLVRQYTAAYPNEVAGLVLVDSSHEEQLAKEKALTGRSYNPGLFMPRFGSVMAHVGLTRIVKPFIIPLPPTVPQQVRALMDQLETSPKDLRTEVTELQQFDDMLVEVQGKGPDLSRVPLTVLTATKGRSPESAAFWLDLQTDLAHRSPNAVHRVTEKSGHYIHWDEPDLVIEAVREMVKRVRP